MLCTTFRAVYMYIHIIQIYSGITSGTVLDGELLYTKILENLFVFAYRLFHEDFSPIFVYMYIYIIINQSINQFYFLLSVTSSMPLALCHGTHTLV